ncbi:MAG: pyroglutamyl-peptidase I [Bacilli bacterium]|nr:pyroglutamyl-peptidase I [Bacilli bacterium]
MKILVTGFEPFLDNLENPSYELLGLLPKSIYGNEIIKVPLPVEFDRCFEVLKPYIDQHKPGIILNVGLAGGRKSISPERVAINVNDSINPDNVGYCPVDQVIIEHGENAYFSTLDIRNIINRLEQKNIPVHLSNSAGTYVCNNLMYHVLHYVKTNHLNCKAGFVHVPFMSEQVKTDDYQSLPIAVILEGIIDIIKACLS